MAHNASDTFGRTNQTGGHFLHVDGCWYKIEPRVLITARVTHFKPI